MPRNKQVDLITCAPNRLLSKGLNREADRDHEVVYSCECK